MPTIDSLTWQALTVLLTLLALMYTWVQWRRKGLAAGVRGLAWALLPAAAYLTGLMRLLWDIADAIVQFAVRLTFSPVVWAGVAILGASVGLFFLAGLLDRRGSGKRGEAADPAAVPTKKKQPKQVGSAKPPADDKMDDDIEAILRKHGIS